MPDVKISIFLEEEWHRKLKAYCAGAGVSLQKFASEAILHAFLTATNQSPKEVVVPQLTAPERRRFLKGVMEIVDGGDPLAIDLLRATIAFYERPPE